VVNTSLLSAALDKIPVVCTVIGLALVAGPSLVLGFSSVVTSFVSDAIDENVNRVFELSVLLTARYEDVSKVDVIQFELSSEVIVAALISMVGICSDEESDKDNVSDEFAIILVVVVPVSVKNAVLP